MGKLFGFVLSIAFAMNAFAQGERISLDGEWDLSFWKQPRPKIECPSKAKPEKTIKAKVPGNVEIDMLAAGLIKDPMIGDNVYALRKYEGYQWLYSRTFVAPKLADEARAILNLRGVDTLADIFINGKKVASTRNMLIAHKFDITDFLKAGENKIEVLISSVVIEAMKYNYPVLSSRNIHSEGLEIRKAPHMFGWDIMPRLISAGLWKSVSIDVQKPERIDDVQYITRRINTEEKWAELFFQFKISSRFEKLDLLRYNFVLERNGKEVASIKNGRFISNNARHIFRLKNVDFWWPRTMGEPALYNATLELLDENGNVIDCAKNKVGLRTIKLDYCDIYPDKDGKFEFVINGKPMFCFGSNWVQVSGYHSQDEALIGEVLKMAKDLNCNMLRCWGGNVYECDAFYDFCDANGILIWQDFSMGCSAPAQSDKFKKEIAEEIAAVVRRLRNHSSIALWAGNNENDISINWALRGLNINPAGDEISRKVIPSVLFSEDPARPYLPSSPYISEDVFKGKAMPSEDHLWGPRGYYKADFYTKSPAKFVSEIGYHGCPNRESLEKMFDKDFVYPWTNKTDFKFNKQWQCKAVMAFTWEAAYANRNSLMTKQAKIIFGEIPTDLDDFIFASQLVQAEAKKYFIEMMRSKKGNRSGILWWNLRDGWPILSDAITDYFNSKKLAYYFIKRVQENELVMINDAFEVVAVNEKLSPCKMSVKIRDFDNGKILLDMNEFSVEANSRKLVANLQPLTGQGMLIIEYVVDGKKRENHYMYGKPPFKLGDVKKWVRALSIKH